RGVFPCELVLVQAPPPDPLAGGCLADAPGHGYDQGFNGRDVRIASVDLRECSPDHRRVAMRVDEPGKEAPAGQVHDRGPGWHQPANLIDTANSLHAAVIDQDRLADAVLRIHRVDLAAKE